MRGVPPSLNIFIIYVIYVVRNAWEEISFDDDDDVSDVAPDGLHAYIHTYTYRETYLLPFFNENKQYNEIHGIPCK